jgi:hypothetical protein
VYEYGFRQGDEDEYVELGSSLKVLRLHAALIDTYILAVVGSTVMALVAVKWESENRSANGVVAPVCGSMVMTLPDWNTANRASDPLT